MEFESGDMREECLTLPDPDKYKPKVFKTKALMQGKAGLATNAIFFYLAFFVKISLNYLNGDPSLGRILFYFVASINFICLCLEPLNLVCCSCIYRDALY